MLGEDGRIAEDRIARCPGLTSSCGLVRWHSTLQQSSLQRTSQAPARPIDSAEKVGLPPRTPPRLRLRCAMPSGRARRTPQARNAHTMTLIGTKLYLFGGHSGNKHLTDLHVACRPTIVVALRLRVWRSAFRE